MFSHEVQLNSCKTMAEPKNPKPDSQSEFPQAISPAASHLEDGKPSHVDNTDEDEEFSYAEQRQIVHRIDRRMLVITGLMYCVSLIDRGNMPNAAVAGMHDDLQTNEGYRYVSETMFIGKCTS